MGRNDEWCSERVTGKQQTFGIGEVENIHTRMGNSIAADFADMRTPGNEWESVLGNML